MEDRERCEVPPPVQEVEVVAEPVEVVVEPEPELVPQPVPAVVEPEPVPRPAPVPVKYEDIELDDFLPSVVREMEPSGAESRGARDGVIALPPIIEVAEPAGPWGCRPATCRGAWAPWWCPVSAPCSGPAALW